MVRFYSAMWDRLGSAHQIPRASCYTFNVLRLKRFLLVKLERNSAKPCSKPERIPVTKRAGNRIRACGCRAVVIRPLVSA